MFQRIIMLSDEQLSAHLAELLKIEARIESDFWAARSKLPDSEKQIGGFESYGVGGKHYAFKNMLIECGLESAS
jgi:hypothetical protein